MTIEENDTQYREMETTKLFSNGDSNEFDAVIIDLMKKNRAQAKEIKKLKLEQDPQAILLCKVTEQKKKSMEDEAMIEDEKKSFDQQNGREIIRAKQDFQHAIGYFESNDDCQQ